MRLFPNLPPRQREWVEVIKHLPRIMAACVWRRLMWRTTFIAITGSFGKTTCKDCLAKILSDAAPTVATRRNSNGRGGVATTILRVRPWHKYAVLEIGTDRPGGMVKASLMARPDIAVILRVGLAHSEAFKTLEGTAFEKSRLLRFMRKDGIAVLNGDDPLVAAMGAPFQGKVVTFGETAERDVAASNATAVWPERLRLTVSAAGLSAEVQTQLVGTHWVTSVVAAMAAAHVCGIELNRAAASLATLQSQVGRMQPVVLPSGAVVLRDDYNGSIESFRAATEVLRTARAQRRILVISDCADEKLKPRRRQGMYARLAKEIAEVAIFLGERSEYAAQRAINEGMDPSCVHACMTLQSAGEVLRQELREGDLVLLRGRAIDHVERAYFHTVGDVACKRTACRRRRACDACEELKFQPTEQLVTLQRTAG